MGDNKCEACGQPMPTPKKTDAEQLLQLCKDMQAACKQMAGGFAEMANVKKQPMPTPPEQEVVTLEALDSLAERLVARQSIVANEAAAMLRALGPLAALAERSPVPLEELVEEVECKRRIVEAGWSWKDASDAKRVLIEFDHKAAGKTTIGCETWPEARDWAEAQAAKREPQWSEPVNQMTGPGTLALLETFGGKRDERYPTTVLLRGAARDAWNRDTDCIRLPAPASGEQR